MTYWYRIITKDEVRPVTLLSLADRLVEWATEDLGLETRPELVWFRRSSSRPAYLRWPRGDEPIPPPRTAEQSMEVALNYREGPAVATLYGRVLAEAPSIVFLRNVRDPTAMALHLLHEMRHVWQYATGSLRSVDDDERDARAYEIPAYVKAYTNTSRE